MKRALLFFAVLTILPGSSARGQDVSDFIHLPAERLESAVREALLAAPAPLVATTLEQRAHHAAIMVRRTESSPPELHEEFDDLYIVQEGGAVLVYGGRYDGGEPTEPGEWRGGIIVDGERQALAAGDVVLVPADVAHQVEIEQGKSIVYHVVKVRRGK